MMIRFRRTRPLLIAASALFLLNNTSGSLSAAFIDGVETIIPTTDGMVRDNVNIAYNEAAHNVGMDSTDARFRTLLVFTLPALPDGTTVKKVELRLVRTGTVGTMDALVDLMHLPNLNTTTPSPSTYSATPANSLTSFDPEATAAEEFSPWMDVTSAVQGDYTNDPEASRIATFRLQIDDADLPDPAANSTHNYYRFRSEENATPAPSRAPELRITVEVPEPASQFVMIGGLLGLAGRRRWRGDHERIAAGMERNGK